MVKRKKAARKQTQQSVVVRVDYVVYIIVCIIAVLALASIVLPGRVEIELIAGLGATLVSVLGGWLAYARLSRNGHDEGDDDEPES